ncbi:unnamed protein product [Moneuplotes crassus]|uniref:Endonuclease/exonuclease/phosphatase domain-containing protein n=1 Tax=Euplotes crassus TaxID=5936 RepID=A0AAD1UK96_EUPCR|nr:unnamed protein product [Moneuplotes crassus]
MKAIGSVCKKIFKKKRETDIDAELLLAYSLQSDKELTKIDYSSVLEKEHSITGDPCPNRVPTYRYFDGSWKEVDPQEEEFNSMNTKSLTFYTQNIWFESHNAAERFETLVQMALDTDADFVCFQEATGPFLKELTENEGIRKKYYISGNGIRGYGVVIISKLPAYFFEFKYECTSMGRSLLVGEVSINSDENEDSTFLVGTSHLESLNNAALRKDQMEYYIDPILGKYDSIFMGDFNFMYHWKNEEDTLNRELFSDMWEELRDSSEEQFTMFKTPEYAEVTFDHIILSLKSKFRPEYIERVGNFSCDAYKEQDPKDINTDGVVRTPSDHLGLVGVINLKE